MRAWPATLGLLLLEPAFPQSAIEEVRQSTIRSQNGPGCPCKCDVPEPALRGTERPVFAMGEAARARLETSARGALHCVSARALRERSVRVVVIGGSATAGAKCATGCNWVAQLESVLRSAPPLHGVNVSFVNYAVPGSCISYAAVNFDALVRSERPDLVLIETAMNDQAMLRYRGYAGKHQGTALADPLLMVQALVRMARCPEGHERPPALLFVEFEPWRNAPGCDFDNVAACEAAGSTICLGVPQCARLDSQRRQQCPVALPCHEALGTVHWPALQRYSLPYVAPLDALCDARVVMPPAESKALHALGSAMRCDTHFDCAAHQVVAAVLAELWLGAVDHEHGHMHRHDHEHRACNATALGRLPASECRSIAAGGSSALRCKPSAKLVPHPGRPTLAPGVAPGWREEEDVRGKPGWVYERGRADGAAALLALELPGGTPGRTVLLEFLATYERIGAARAWIGPAADSMAGSAPVRLEGLWAEKVSLGQFETITAPAPRHAEHRHEQRVFLFVQPEPEAPKFKLISVTVCADWKLAEMDTSGG